MPADLAIPAGNKTMTRVYILIIFILALISCKPTKKIQTAINTKKDTVTAPVVDHAKEDSARFIKDTYHVIMANQINFTTFSAKMNVDYVDADDKKYNVNATVRMYKVRVVRVSVNEMYCIYVLG